MGDSCTAVPGTVPMVRKSVGVGMERRADTRDFWGLKWAENRAEGGVKMAISLEIATK